MSHLASRRVTNAALTWIVIMMSLALLTPWGIAHRNSFEPRFELVAVVFATLSGASFFVKGVMSALSRHGGWRAASQPFCMSISLLLVAATFAWLPRGSEAQTYTIGGALFFMLAAAVLLRRANERAEPE
jgi:hypothetical protein